MPNPPPPSLSLLSVKQCRNYIGEISHICCFNKHYLYPESPQPWFLEMDELPSFILISRPFAIFDPFVNLSPS